MDRFEDQFLLMRILLIGIQNSGSRFGHAGLFLPLGLAYISASLKKEGYSYTCMDLHNEEILDGKSFNSWERVKAVDLSLYNVVAFGGVFMKYELLKMLSQRIWEFNKNMFQVVGGNMATTISGIILRYTKVDCVCLSEGEETIVELAGYLKRGKDWKVTKGLKYLNEEGEIVSSGYRGKIKNLDLGLFPDRGKWSFDILMKSFPYGSPGRYSAIMFASRGCPFSCIFCNPVSGKSIRTRSSENIVSEMKYLKNKWNIQYIRFFDEVFLGSKEKIKQLCEIIIKEKLNVYWWCQLQIRIVDEATLRLMKKAGCIEISYGIESGSDVILSEMRKGITKELARKIIEMTDKIGIRPSISIIAGTPSENYNTLKETNDFLVSLNHINWVQVPSIGLIVPIPGTTLFDIAKERGLIKNERMYLTKEMSELNKYSKTINLTTMPDKEYFDYIRKCNDNIKNDYYKKHPLKWLLSFLGLDHLRLDLMFRNFSLSQIRPIYESIIWSTLGKRDNMIGRICAGIIYKR